jgi:hypothetical protein
MRYFPAYEYFKHTLQHTKAGKADSSRQKYEVRRVLT